MEKTEMLHDPKQILNSANSFYAAFYRCNEHRHIDGNQVQWLALPAIVNATFACELYLKACLYCEQPKPEGKLGHKLNELFDQLTPTLQEKIKQFLPQYTFEICLDEVSNAFVEWRYVYEQSSNSINLAFLTQLLETLKTVAMSELEGML